jgi:tRNA (guanine37-N1)-methyltransferase
MSLFRPPIVRSAAATLDRSLFAKTIPIAAARILDVKKISQHRSQLSKTNEILKLERFTNIRPDPDQALASKGGKCFLLNPQVKPGGICQSKSGFDLFLIALQSQRHGVAFYKRLFSQRS